MTGRASPPILPAPGAPTPAQPGLPDRPFTMHTFVLNGRIYPSSCTQVSAWIEPRSSLNGSAQAPVPLVPQCGTGSCWSDRIAGSFVLHYADAMARPRGRTKPARLTVNLDRPTYASLVDVAKREDVSVSWVVRRAIETLLARDRAAPVGPALTAPTDDGNRTGSGEMTPQ